ncbi:MAG: hypothetical protein Q8M29_08590 [Bacteroidota bacterium]|nr:hypothetical protein [Bacteroidota bacterium]
MTEQHLNKFFINPDLVQQLLLQLEKDFVHSDLFGNYDREKLQGKDIYDIVHEKVKELMNRNYGELANTYYRIDISERQLKDALTEDTSHTESEVITTLILKRELQKVVYRNIYKQSKEDDTSA